MIIKIERGWDAEGLLTYQRRLDKSPEEQAGVRLFARHKIFDVENAPSALNRIARKSGLAHPIVHLILRAERGLSDEEWRVSLNAALDAAHLQGRPYVAFLHDHDDDTEGEHMHVALVVADSNGCPPPRFLRSKSLKRIVTEEEAKALPSGDVRSRSWDSQVKRRLMTAAREIEDRLGLRPLARDRAAQAEERGHQARVSPPARHRQKKDGTTPLIERIDVTEAQAALDSSNWDLRTAALAELGLRLAPVYRKNGSLTGLRIILIADSSVYFPASDLGSAYGLGALNKRSAQSFADWHATAAGGDLSPAMRAPARLADNPVKANYDLEMDRVERRRQKIRTEKQKLSSWRDEQYRKARDLKEARWPQTRSGTSRVLRSEITKTYRQQCEAIKLEFAAQRKALDERWPHKPTYVEWLAEEAQYDSDAARELTRLTGKGVTPVVQAPSPVTPPTLTGAELAAKAQEQEERLKQAEQLREAQKQLDQGPALAALSLRMEGAAIALLVEADQRDRRVTIEKDAILIDGRRLTGIGEQDRVTQTAQNIAAEQERQIRDLAMQVDLSADLPPRTNIEPRVWLENLTRTRRYVRWLTPEQDKTVRGNWAANAQAAAASPAPIVQPTVTEVSVVTPSQITTPAATPPVRTSAPLPPPASVEKPSLVPTKRLEPAPSPVQQAFAMIAAQAKAPLRAAPLSPAPTKPPAKEPPVPVAPEPAPVKPAPPVVSFPAQPSARPSISPATPATYNKDADLLSSWLAACAAAERNPDRAHVRDAAAARLMADEKARTFVDLLDPDRQADLERQVSAHHERRAPIAKPTAPGRAAPVAPPMPVAEEKSAPQAASPEDLRRLHLQRQMQLAWNRSPKR